MKKVKLMLLSAFLITTVGMNLGYAGEEDDEEVVYRDEGSGQGGGNNVCYVARFVCWILR